ncbi:SAVED domain-containing protein [bacterium]|nr:SAVED domain-containing protein [bacterium]MBU1982895.1 SAVED domain-containing protein [bacterium]
MSRPSIPDKTITRLWVLAGGRCEYEGCNRILWRDDLTLTDMNTAYVAHVVAAEPNGPRGDPDLSPKLATDISNLLLMCDAHHRLIDREDVLGHTVGRLTAMKKSHETRIELLTALDSDYKSHILFYGANIGEKATRVSWELACEAMIPRRYPAEKPAIELSLSNSAYEDDENGYWGIESENLRRQFETRVRQRLTTGEIHHLSVFAFAPQPLLIELGRLLSDIPMADVYQLHREPANWAWQDHPEGFEYIIHEPPKPASNAALVLSLSATIEDARILEVLGNDTAIWRISAPTPNNDFLKSTHQLRQFREIGRRLFDLIKMTHREKSVIHVFPAAPVSVAIEIGRVWMPKADLPLRVYDQNRKRGGFVKAIDFSAH